MSQHGIGDRVNHVSYGDGTVRNVNEYHTAIEFDGVGLRTFATSKVVLQPSSTPEPAKPPKRGRAKKATATAKEPVQPVPNTPSA